MSMTNPKDKDYAFIAKPKEFMFDLLYTACSNPSGDYYNTYTIQTHCSTFDVKALPIHDEYGNVSEYVILGWEQVQ